jgi:hypothetical protein
MNGVRTGLYSGDGRASDGGAHDADVTYDADDHGFG